MMFYEMIDSTTSQFDYTDYCEVIMILCTQEVVVLCIGLLPLCGCSTFVLVIDIEQIRPAGSHN